MNKVLAWNNPSGPFSFVGTGKSSRVVGELAKGTQIFWTLSRFWETGATLVC